MAADGNHLRQLSKLQQDIEDYAWSPDGGRIVVISSDRGNDRLHVVRAADGAVECVADPERQLLQPALGQRSGRRRRRL